VARPQRFALLGHPVAHSVSPAMCMAAFQALRLTHFYTAMDVPSVPNLRSVVDDLRSGLIAGANVTVPYKRSVLDLCDGLDQSAEEVGAANVLVVDRKRRVIAHNTDAEALTLTLGELLGSRPRMRAAVIGAGGAGMAAIAACKRLGFSIVCVTSRSWTSMEAMFDAPSAEKARDLGALTALWPGAASAAPSTKTSQLLRLQWRELVSQADCVIQATSAGMIGADPGESVCLIVPWDRLPRHALAYDVVYNPPVTPFLRVASAQGLEAYGGLGMLVRQAELAIRLWTGQTPPRDRMHEAAVSALEKLSRAAGGEGR
jgi:shikimate dehydrogenase